MFRATSQHLSPDIYQCQLLKHDRTLSYGEVIGLWKGDRDFRLFFCQTLRHIPFAAYRWETPAISLDRLEQEFEFTAIASPDLERPSQRQYFEPYFQDQTDSIVSFKNLGGDAELLVPLPQVADDSYGHLGKFMNQAPQAQQEALWQQVGILLQSRVSVRPLWLSTAGGGVAWLHIRLDQRPKYYRYQPYVT